MENSKVTLVALAAGILTIILIAILITNIIYTYQNIEKPLIYVDIPAESDTATKAHWQPLMDWMTEQLGREVKMLTVTDYAAVTEALKYGHADIARYGSSSYVLAEREVDIIPVASIANDDGSLMAYQSYIIARPGVTDLNGATFAYVDIASTSGYLLPATYFMQNGIELGETVFAGTHPAVIEAVKNGSVDAGAIASTRWLAAVEQGVIDADELVILWQSQPVPRGPTVVRADMPEELRLAIQDAFINAPPEIVAQCNLKNDRFGPAPPDVYEPIREIQRYIGLVE